MMRRNEVLGIIREIALSTNQPEAVVTEMYTIVEADMKRDARIMDFVPLLAAKRVREDLGRVRHKHAPR